MTAPERSADGRALQRPYVPVVLHRVPEVVRMALAQTGLPAVDAAVDQGAGRFVFYDVRLGRRPPLLAGQRTIELSRLELPHQGATWQALADERSAMRQWQTGGLQLIEETARIDKAAVRRCLMSRLRAELESQGGRWICLSPYPFPYRSAFNLRLDHDCFAASDFDRTLHLLRHHQHAASHYICGGSHAAHLERLARLRGCDVGSHGYWHHTYRTFEENLRNVRRGIELLEEAGLAPTGFVAPHGRYSRALVEALESLRVTHSSEFGLAYDELPFFPTRSRVLQVPVHPICLGLFLEAARRQQANEDAAARAAADHFVKLAVAKYRAGEPIFFYGHPDGRLGRYPEVISRMLATVDNLTAVWQVSLSRFAGWWRARQAIRVQVRPAGDALEISATGLPGVDHAGLELWIGPRVALVPLDSRTKVIPRSALALETRDVAIASPNWRIDGAHDWKQRLRRYLDWEKVTPVDEIPRTSLRNWTKRTLRKLKG